MSKTRCQTEKEQVCMAFGYELCFSTITVCAHSAATTTIGTAIGEEMALADADCKFHCSHFASQVS